MENGKIQEDKEQIGKIEDLNNNEEDKEKNIIIGEDKVKEKNKFEDSGGVENNQENNTKGITNEVEQEMKQMDDKKVEEKIEENNKENDNKIEIDSNKEKNIIIEEKPSNFGHTKMRQIYEEIKTEALNKSKNRKKIQEQKIEERKEEEKEEGKEEEITKESIEEDKYIDITDDGGIKKKIIKKGKGECPIDGNLVFVNYIGKYEDKVFEQSEESFSITLGEDKIMKGLEIAIKSMQMKEKSEFIMSPKYTYGDNQVKDWIPPNSDLIYEIELILFQDTCHEHCLSKMTYEEKLQWGRLLKKEGAEKFISGDIMGAKECFVKALTFLKTMDPNKEEEAEGVDLYLKILSNICNCFNKEKEYNSLIEIATVGLKIRSVPKLLYFRAIAYCYIDNFEDAKNDIEQLEQILGNENNEVINTIAYIKSLYKERKQIWEEKNNLYSRAIFRQFYYYDKPMLSIPLIPPQKRNPLNPVVFFEIKIGEENKGKILFELFKDFTPVTAENFRYLCIENDLGMSYKGSFLNKVIKGFVIGGGDIGNIGHQKSIYGEYFEDENFMYGHCRRGILTMDNSGKNTNGSKFLITLKYIPWYDGRHVVFGRVIKGIELIKEIENVDVDENDKPLIPIIINNCGEIPQNEEIIEDVIEEEKGGDKKKEVNEEEKKIENESFNKNNQEINNIKNEDNSHEKDNVIIKNKMDKGEDINENNILDNTIKEEINEQSNSKNKSENGKNEEIISNVTNSDKENNGKNTKPEGSDKINEEK